MIAPVGEKLLFEHTKFSATRGGGITHPYHPHPVSATGPTTIGVSFGGCAKAEWWTPLCTDMPQAGFVRLTPAEPDINM